MTKEYSLCAEAIDQVSADVVESLKKFNVGQKEILRIRLSTEECLEKYFNSFGEHVTVTVKCEKKFSEIRLLISVRCGRWDPFSDNGDDFDILNKMLRELSVAPVWNYRGGSNVISFSIKSKKAVSDFVFYIAAAVLGIFGGLLAAKAPGDFAVKLCDMYFAPVSDVLMGLLNSLSVIMVFTSIVSGICSMGDMRVFKKIGLKMILRFGVIISCCLVLVTAVSLLFFPLDDSGSSVIDTASLWQTVVNIVPVNIFKAFYTGNVLQIIFISVICGTVLLATVTKTTYMVDWFENVNQMVLEMLRIAIKPMPVVVFINIFRLAALKSVSDFSNIYKYVLIMVICCVIMTVFSVLSVCFRQKVPLKMLIKKLMPTYLIALSTASSAAAYTTNVDTCEKAFGIDKKIYGMGIPLGQIVFKPCTVFQPMCGCLCFAALYGIRISLPQLIVIMFTVFILAIAEPPVPGVLVCCFTLLFSQIGVPMEALSIILALECILDRLGTSTNLLSLQTELIRFSDSVSLLDRSKLCR